jgi:hypothetical protein
MENIVWDAQKKASTQPPQSSVRMRSSVLTKLHDMFDSPIPLVWRYVSPEKFPVLYRYILAPCATITAREIEFNISTTICKAFDWHISRDGVIESIDPRWSIEKLGCDSFDKNTLQLLFAIEAGASNISQIAKVKGVKYYYKLLLKLTKLGLITVSSCPDEHGYSEKNSI